MDKPMRGRIIWGVFPNSDGTPGTKEHRAVIVSSDESIKAGKPLIVAPITSQVGEDPDNEVRIPHVPGIGHPRTKLTVPSVALRNWLPVVNQDDVRKYGGWVDGVALRNLLERIEELGTSL